MTPSCLPFYQQRVNHTLSTLLTTPSPAPTLDKAMHYVMLEGGKRFRAALVFATTQALEGSLYLADPAACATELVHAYSLVHDDLPAMDDDDWRRGKPSCHKQFNEAIAILVGDSLQTLAFSLLAAPNELPPTQQLKQIQILAQAIGYQGMAAGQAIDIESVGQALTQQQLESMHHLKTGVLIQACVKLGALCVPHTTPAQYHALEEYAQLLGLAFQVHDDVLDATGSQDTLGKQPGADAFLNKPTFTSLLGVNKSIAYANELITNALEKIAIFGENASNLRELARFCIERTQ